jgi:hypothetical protein
MTFTLKNIAKWREDEPISHKQLNKLGVTDGQIRIWRSRQIAVCIDPFMRLRFRSYYSGPIKTFLLQKQSKKVAA